MISALIDAGPIIALFDRNDQHHDSVMSFMRNFNGQLISTWAVMTEVSYMLDFHHQTRMDFLDWVSEGGIDLYNLDRWQLSNVREIMERYSSLPADFADATLIEAAEIQDLDSIITLDKDFGIYKLKNGKHLKNLIAEASL